MPELTVKSLYAQYLAERCGHSIIETDEGFATYEIDGSVLYIRDIFVIQDARRQGLASQIADQVCDLARAKGCTVLIGTIDPTTHGAHESLLGLLAYGMRLSHLSGALIVLKKDLTEVTDGHG